MTKKKVGRTVLVFIKRNTSFILSMKNETAANITKFMILPTDWLNPAKVKILSMKNEPDWLTLPVWEQKNTSFHNTANNNMQMMLFFAQGTIMSDHLRFCISFLFWRQRLRNGLCVCLSLRLFCFCYKSKPMSDLKYFLS